MLAAAIEFLEDCFMSHCLRVPSTVWAYVRGGR